MSPEMVENEHNELYPEDQARVDEYLRQGYNDVERKPFRPFRLLAVLVVIVTGLSITALALGRLAGAI